MYVVSKLVPIAFTGIIQVYTVQMEVTYQCAVGILV